MATRLDRSVADLSAKLNKNGYLVATVRPTRTGILLYKNTDGSTRREYRPPDEVFAEDSLDSLRGIPITLEHPDAFLTADNTHLHQIGHVRDDVRPDGDYLSASAIVTRGDAIAQIGDGTRREVSCGYTCDLEDAPEGADYDFTQRNIIYNHLALVTKGRAGPGAAFNVDAAEICDILDELIVSNDVPKAGKVSMKIVIDSVEIEVADEVAASYSALQGERDALKSQIAELNEKASKLDSLAVQFDALAVKTAELEAQASPAAIESRVAARLELIAQAQILAPEIKCDGMDLDTIRRAVVAFRSPCLKLDGATLEYIRAAFDVISAIPVDKNSNFAKDVVKRGDGEKPDARAAAIKASQDLRP